MAKTTDTTTHKRVLRTLIDRKELASIIAETIGRRNGVNVTEYGTSYDVSFTDEMEGSPQYRVGTKAEVTITIDMSVKPTTEDRHL